MRKLIWSAVIVMVLGALTAAGCGTGTSTTETGTSATGKGEPILTVEGNGKTKSYTLEQIKALKPAEGFGGWITTTGSITAPVKYTGVTLAEVTSEVGGIGADNAVSVVAEDGYEMTFSQDQIGNDAQFVTYDDATGDEMKAEGPFRLVLAYAREGKPLDAKGDGVLRITILGPKADSITDGHWWVKWVNKVVVKKGVKKWSLKMTGLVDDTVDRGSFESCAAPKCHGKSWKDSEGREWSGCPLWLMMGRVDDKAKHGDASYNDALAEKGYDIVVTAGDGFSTTITSAQSHLKDDLIVANKVDGVDLAKEDQPLKLVGPGLTNKQMVSGIASIALVEK